MYEITVLTVWFNEMFSGFRTIPYGVALQLLGCCLAHKQGRSSTTVSRHKVLHSIRAFLLTQDTELEPRAAEIVTLAA